MSLFEPDFNGRTDTSTIQLHQDHDILFGSSNGTNEVAEVVVYPPAEVPGGYVEVPVEYYYTDGVFMNETAFVEWLNDQADAFADAHVIGDAGDTATLLIKDALRRLWLNSFSGTNASVQPLPPWSGPLGSTFTQGELLAALEKIYVHIGPHGRANPAETDPPDAQGNMHIYIDTGRLDPYMNAFGPYKGINYVIYHEIGHAMPDARPYDTSGHSTRELFANEYGQALAEATGALYPNDVELGAVGGTFSR